MLPLFSGSKSLSLIEVDPEYCGDQGEGLYCFPFWNYEKDKFVYSGFDLEMLVDLRDVEEDLFCLEYTESTNEMVLSKSMMAATMRKDKEAFDKRVSEDFVKKANEAARSKASKLKGPDLVQQYAVRLPTGVKLTCKPFMSAANAGNDDQKQKIKPNLVVYKVDTPHKDSNSTTIYQFFARLCWRICDAATVRDMSDTVDAGVETVKAGLAGI